jgi:hypothetical protein
MFQKYDDYLNGVKEFDNYWSDVGISEAVGILNCFSDLDWDILGEKISEKSQIWLVSCAETLGEASDLNHAYTVLLQLSCVENDEVKAVVKESIQTVVALRGG